MTMKRSWIAAFAILACLMFAWATGAGRPYPATAGGVIDPTCTSSLPCIEYDNNSTGPGIRGISVAGNGLAGSTKNHTTSASNGRAGLIGNDVGTGTFNSGVHGLSVNGTGVSGQSTSGPGVRASSVNGAGISTTSTFSNALIATTSSQPAILASTSANDGINSATANNSTLEGRGRSGIYAHDDSTDGGRLNVGVEGASINGIGVQGNSTNWVGMNAVGGFLYIPTSQNFPALSVVGNGTGADLISACKMTNPCVHGLSVFSVDPAGGVDVGGKLHVNNLATVDYLAVGFAAAPGFGSVDIDGQYQKSGSCVAGCTVATAVSAGRAVTTYAPMVSQPTLEDFGEAQLVNGQASVRLDPKFANVVEQRSNYLVFITPEGDANTLYVTQKTLGGFTVRESH